MENLNELKPVGKLSPFAHFCCTIGNLPASYMISLTYEEQLLWLCNYLEKTVIPAVNTNAEAVAELQSLYNQLKDYVDNYFDNLDVQNEINIKLDEMAEDGTLQEIITSYLNVKGILAFNTKADMKNATNIVEGSFIKTFGNLELNDGLGEFYKIRKIQNTDIIDDINIIAITTNTNLVAELIINRIETIIEVNTISDLKNGIYKNNDTVFTSGFYTINDGGNSQYKIRIKNENEIPDEMTVISLNNNQNLVAELLYNTEINILQLGAKRWDGTNEYDNKSVIDKAISLFPHGGIINIPVGKFYTSGNHIIDTYGKLTIKGSGVAGFNDGTTIELLNGANYGFWIRNEIYFDVNIMVNNEISNLHLIGNDNLENGIIISDHFGSICKDLYITNIPNGNAIKLFNYNHFTEGTILENCHIRTTLNGIKVERNQESETATESFFNTQINHCIMSLDIDNSIFINLNQFENETDKPIVAYSWNINITAWYNSNINNNYVIRVGNSNMLSGNSIITVDGLHNNQVLIKNSGSGLISLEGNINYNNSYGLPSINDTKFDELLSDSSGDSDGYNRGRTQYKGAKIFNGERISTDKANSVIYESGWLCGNQIYRLNIFEETQGTKKTNSYLVSTMNSSFAPYIKKLTDAPTMFYPRPKNGYEQGSIHTGEGAQFEIYCANIETIAPMYFTLEMI